MVKGWAAIVLLAAAGVAQAAPEAKRPLRLEDAMHWATASGARISPDGRTIVFRRTDTDPATDDSDGKLWIMAADGSRQRLLCDCGSGTWLPDGRLTYQKTADGARRFIVRTVDGPDKVGPEQRVAFTGKLPGGPSWSRDSRQLAFVSSAPKEGGGWPIALPPAPAGAKWAPPPTIIDGWQYRTGVASYSSSNQQIFIAPGAGGEVRQLTRGNWNVGAFYSGIEFGTSIQWSADGRTIFFDGGPRATDDVAGGQRSDINAVDVATGNITRLTRADGFWNDPQLSPDGRLIAYTGNAASPAAFPVRQIRVMNADGSGDRILWNDTPDRIFQMMWASDGKSLLASVNHEGATELVSLNLQGHRRVVARGDFRFYITSVAPGVAVGSISTATRDAEVGRIDLKTGRVSTLTKLNPMLDDIALASVEPFWTTSPDGTRVQAWLMKPPGYDPAKKYPMIVDIHGGPDAMAGWDFDFRHHDFATRGYLVLYANPRGSTGYGAAFANGIDGGFPGRRDAEDMEAVVRAAFTRAPVDQSRVFVMGCSGGGSLSTWMTSKTRLFAAAAVMCAVTDWISMAGTTDATTWSYTRYGKPFWEDPRPWLDHSPLMQVGSITAPTLIAIGGRDQRTPVSQSAELYTALRFRGIPTRLLVFPDEGHGPWRGRPSDMMRLQLYVDEWFRTLGHPTSSTAPASGAP